MVPKLIFFNKFFLQDLDDFWHRLWMTANSDFSESIYFDWKSLKSFSMQFVVISAVLSSLYKAFIKFRWPVDFFSKFSTMCNVLILIYVLLQPFLKFVRRKKPWKCGSDFFVYLVKLKNLVGKMGVVGPLFTKSNETKA